MQLTEQQRAELERRGWRLENTCGEFGTWVKGQSIATLYADGFCTFSGNPKDALEFTAIAGGYRLVPEEVAERGLRHIASVRLTLEMVEKDLRRLIQGAWLVPNIHTDEDGVIELLRERLRQQMGGESRD